MLRKQDTIVLMKEHKEHKEPRQSRIDVLRTPVFKICGLLEN
jgi:hypothetical protein